MGKTQEMDKEYEEKFLKYLNEEKQLHEFSKKDQKRIQKDWNKFEGLVTNVEEGKIKLEEVPSRYGKLVKTYLDEQNAQEIPATEDIVDAIMSEVEGTVEGEKLPMEPISLVDELKEELKEVKKETKAKRPKTKKKSPDDDYVTVQGQVYGDIKSLTRQARFEQGILPWNLSGAAAYFWEEMDRAAQANSEATSEEVKEVATPIFVQTCEDKGFHCDALGRVKTLYSYWRKYSNFSPDRGKVIERKGGKKKEPLQTMVEDLTAEVEEMATA